MPFAFLAIALLAIWSINVFWGGFVAATLWGWFVVPLGAPAISFWHAAGLGALVSVFLGSRGTPQGNKTDTDSMLLMGFVYSVFIPLLSLAAGLVARMGM